MPKAPPYSQEFKCEAVQLLRTSGRSVPQLADELRRENKILAEEREILKKAAAFFASESKTR